MSATMKTMNWYPRSLAKSELSSMKNTELQNIKLAYIENKKREIDKKEATLIDRRNFNYICGYSYLMDGITAYCTDHYFNGGGRIVLLENNYYSIQVKQNELEQICLGRYAKNSAIKQIFWEKFMRIVREPKTLIMNTNEGTYLGEPIRILIKRNEEANEYINRQGGNTRNLKNQKVTNPIEYIQIDFFRPLFKTVVEEGKEWIALPRHLQATLEYAKLKQPELFEFTYRNTKGKLEKVELTTEIARKYFLYVMSHDNSMGNTMHIDAIKFWLCVNPRKILETREDKKTKKYYLKDIFKNALELNALTRMHATLVKQDLLEGIKFTICKSEFNESKKEYSISIYRGNPLSSAPEYKINSKSFLPIIKKT